MPQVRKIVLTGGPGSGKTVISCALAERYPGAIVRVPEAATQVYEAAQTRWDKLDEEGRRNVQRRIYHLQLEQEDRLAAENPGKLLLLDRGSVDGAAYWPAGPADYWRDLGTTAQAELSRYAAVIWMQSTAAIGLYDGDLSNPCRYEDANAAMACGEALRALWVGHQRFVAIEAFEFLEQKIAAVWRVVDAILAEWD